MKTTPKIGLIADDFTGAMDSGAQFSYSNLSVHFRFTGQIKSDVEIINTASREMDETSAVDLTLAACQTLAGRQLFKKIDSTLRGHVGAETLAVLSAGGYHKAVICPAVPLQGRLVCGGRLYVNGVALDQTSFKDDPVYPAKSSFIAQLIKAPTYHLPLELVRGPFSQLVSAISKADQPLITADTETSGDLDSLAQAILETHSLPVGAFGLANAFLRAINIEIANHSHFRPDWPVLVLVGSANKVTRDQVSALDSRPENLVLKFDATHAPALIDQLFGQIPSEKCNLILCANQDKTIRSLDWLEFGKTISEIGLKMLGQFQPKTIVVVGGETATHFCRLIQAESIQILGESMPGIPFGRIQGGRLDQCLVVTKAGGFGFSDTLVNILCPEEG